MGARPRRLRDRFLQVGEARDTLTHRLGRAPSISDIATHLDCTEEDVLEAMEAAGGYRADSLDALTRAGGRPLIDTIGGEDDALTAGLDRIQLGRAVAALTDEDRYLLRSYYVDKHTQAEIAKALSISQMQVSRRLANLRNRLRQWVTANPDPGPTLPMDVRCPTEEDQDDEKGPGGRPG